jgi:hypothetical protein
MISQSPYSLAINDNFDQKKLSKNTWLVILHASRIPPHVGVVIDGNYNSLTIKGHELNVHISALLKTVQQKKIEALFIQLKYHPVFSTDYQKEICQHYIQQFTQVKPNEASCLSPVKLFLQEFYAMPLITEELLFELMERLKQNNYIMDVFELNINRIEENEFSLPIYSNKELQEVIKRERAVFYKD